MIIAGPVDRSETQAWARHLRILIDAAFCHISSTIIYEFLESTFRNHSPENS